ncbi:MULTISPECIES: formylglycine-generating enzyme family protein [Streptomycetaceae]|uniref:formylglycine-generating enzyme family protein n=1 Tax=Embleya scabrispora TaxID=159449 RepID=UPI000378BA57
MFLNRQETGPVVDAALGSGAGNGSTSAIRPGHTGACCGPRRPAPDAPTEPAAPASSGPRRRAAAPSLRGMVRVPEGPFLMGGDDADAFPTDGEGPVREVHVPAFHIDATTVSNARFAMFTKSTGYRTDAERIGWSYVFDGFVHPRARAHVLAGTVPGAPWWRPVAGAGWRTPEGPGSGIGDRPNHPVTHISWNDAAAYAEWAEKRLPTEAEWEKAARGGLVRKRFPWGDELAPRGRPRCNIWQGDFPHRDPATRGRPATVPVDAFAPNGFGLYNVAGNVWEWCADRYSTDWHAPRTPATRVDPQGPPTGDTHVLRGGSHMCHASYCNRYRVAARSSNTPDSSAGHMGFRCAASA